MWQECGSNFPNRAYREGAGFVSKMIVLSAALSSKEWSECDCLARGQLGTKISDNTPTSRNLSTYFTFWTVMLSQRQLSITAVVRGCLFMDGWRMIMAVEAKLRLGSG